MKVVIPGWNWGVIRALKRESPNVEYTHKEHEDDDKTEISLPDAVAVNCAKIFHSWGFTDAAIECEKVDLSYLREMAEADSENDLRSPSAQGILKETKARVDAVTPPGQKVFEHQHVAVAFLEARNGRAMLADEQGCGKSIEVLLWLKINPTVRPAIIFGPGFLCPQWETEIKKWMPEESSYIVESGKDGLPLGPQIVLMSYDLFAREPEKWFSQMLMLFPRAIICDQVELLKDFSAKRTRAVIGAIRALETIGGAQAVIPMSGGPLINRASEYYVPLFAVDPFCFAHRQTFEKMYCGGTTEIETYKKNGRTKRFRRWISANDDEKVRALKFLVSHYAIRRYKRDVFKDLPEFRRSKITVQPEPNAYQRYITACNSLKQAMLNPSNNAPQGFLPGNVLAALTAARREAGLCKIQPVAEWISYKLENDKDAKVLAFCHHNLVMDAAVQALKEWNPLTIRGGDNYSEREEAKNKFNHDSSTRLLIAKTRAGGIGLNLQGATDVVFLERDWSPTKEVESEARADRYSDEIVKESTTAWYFHAKGTFDEKVAVILEQKKKIINAIVGEGKVVSLDVANELLEELSREWGVK